jgi:predicted transcriptional regulator of viral defense system
MRRKGDDAMNGIEKIHNIINAGNGIARTADFIKAGYPNYVVSDLYKRGIIERVRNGYYALPKQDEREEETIARLFSDCVVCRESALFHYGYSDKTPLEWHLAVTRNATRSRFKIDYPPISSYMVSESLFALGAVSEDWNGVTLLTYDRERTICDCFKHRAQMDSELFAKAVNAYVVDDKKNLGNLSQYAKRMRVYTKVTDLMEVLLNG